MRVGICVGHSRRGDKGAVSVGNVSEWNYNKILAEHLYEDLMRRGISAFIIDDYNSATYWRGIDNAAKELYEEGATHALELHFNSAGPTATGSETLYWRTSSKGKALAAAIQDHMADEFPSHKDRGIKPKDARQRGGRFLKKTHCPAVITEPFFGSNPNDWRTFQTAHARLAHVYASALESLR